MEEIKPNRFRNTWVNIFIALAVIALIVWLFFYLKTGLSIQHMLEEGKIDEYCAMKYKPYMKALGEMNELPVLNLDNISLKS